MIAKNQPPNHFFYIPNLYVLEESDPIVIIGSPRRDNPIIIIVYKKTKL